MLRGDVAQQCEWFFVSHEQRQYDAGRLVDESTPRYVAKLYSGLGANSPGNGRQGSILPPPSEILECCFIGKKS